MKLQLKKDLKACRTNLKYENVVFSSIEREVGWKLNIKAKNISGISAEIIGLNLFKSNKSAPNMLVG
jgi:hypothetical protein